VLHEPFVWVSPRLRADSPSGQRVSELLNAGRVAGLRGLAQRSGIAVVLHTDGSIACAVVTSPNALLCWQRAVLSPGIVPRFAGPQGGRRSVRNTLAEVVREFGMNGSEVNLHVVAQLVDGSIPPTPDPLWCPLVIRQPLCDHLAANVASTHPTITHPLYTAGGALSQLLATPQDARSGAPSFDANAATWSVPPAPPLVDADAGGLRRWLNASVTPGPFPISRLLADVHRRRTDLRETFVDLRQEHHRIGLWRWAAAFGADEVEGAFLPAWATTSATPLPIYRHQSKNLPTSQPRIQATRVVGFLDATLGLGEAARLLVRDLERSGQSIDTFTYEHTAAPKCGWTDRFRPGQPPADIEILCLNGDQLIRWSRVEPETSSTPYRIGLWFAETPDLSPAMAKGFDYVNEVWVTSPYTYDAVSAAAPARVAVRLVPLGCPSVSSSTKSGSVMAKHALSSQVSVLRGAENRQWCGFSFDLSSRLSRKNPLGLIEAWKLATVPATIQQPLLILKTFNGELHPQSLALLQRQIEDFDNVVLIDRPWSTDLHRHFLSSLDAYVSLHRAEGYGLVLLEAMALGVPVIATGATGNLAFMSPTNSWLVPAEPMQVTDETGHYGTTTLFEPNISAAASCLVEVLRGGSTVDEQVAQARRDVAGLADGSVPAAWMQRRLSEIRYR
jgi:glycosyltransferase involved in cell wall biosynthesis